MQDMGETIGGGNNARPLKDTIAGTGPGIPDDALTPGETELPEAPTEAEVEQVAKALDAPVPDRDEH
jgi:hypothetical protein